MLILFKLIFLHKTLKIDFEASTDNIFDSQAQSAPTFPFETNFVIDGINGFRYGDVLQFNALPKRYRVNTVFSIIGLTHTINTTGKWTTDIKCIMRPRIGKNDE